MKSYFFCLLVIILCKELEGQFFNRNEKIVVNIEHFLPCSSEEDNRLKLNLGTHKYNRTHIATDMNITLYEPFDSKYKLTTELRLWGDGGWKRNVFRYSRNDPCVTLHIVLGEVWGNILDAAKVPRICPVPAGFYEFHDYHIGITNVPFLTRTGRYLFLLQISKHGLLQGCFTLSAVVKSEPIY